MSAGASGEDAAAEHADAEAEVLAAPDPPGQATLAAAQMAEPGAPEPPLLGHALWLVTRAEWLGSAGATEDREHAVSEASALQPEESERSAVLNTRFADAEDRVTLRNCLRAQVAPYPALRRPLRLTVAVQTAADLWASEDEGSRGLAGSALAKLLDTARAGTHELLGQASSLIRWGSGLLTQQHDGLQAALPAGEAGEAGNGSLDIRAGADAHARRPPNGGSPARSVGCKRVARRCALLCLPRSPHTAPGNSVTIADNAALLNDEGEGIDATEVD